MLVPDLSIEKFTPFEKRVMSKFFESGSAFDVSLMIEVLWTDE
tara:strand:+ start:900 stop:1028 length:129 start_codon:yes stop_codon:yes gene_type:complete